MHAAQAIIGTVAGEGRQHLDAHTLEVILHHFLVALNVVLADVVDHVVAGDLRLDRAHLVVQPADANGVMTTRLTRSAKARRVADEDIDARHLVHHLLRHGVDVVADQRRGAGLIDRHALDLGESLEGFDDVLLQQFLGTEDDMLFLHVGGKGILQLKVVVVADVTLGLPSVIGAADRAVTDVDHVLHRRPDHVLGATIGTAALGDRSGDRRQIAKRQRVAQLLAGSLQNRMLLALRNTCTAIKLVVGH